MAGLGKRTLFGVVTVFWLLSSGMASLAQAPEGGLRAQIEALAAAEGFSVKGISQIGAAPALTLPRRAPRWQLESLLGGHEYILLHNAEGGIAELRILDPHASFGTSPQRYALPSMNTGGMQVVTVQLVSSGRKSVTLPFILDPEATTVMLSTTYIP